MPKHPIQPLVLDKYGVLRFKANEIVIHLLRSSGLGMNEIARLQFSREDREQFAQLIGYSHGGSSDLNYISQETLDSSMEEYLKNTGKK